MYIIWYKLIYFVWYSVPMVVMCLTSVFLSVKNMVLDCLGPCSVVLWLSYIWSICCSTVSQESGWVRSMRWVSSDQITWRAREAKPLPIWAANMSLCLPNILGMVPLILNSWPWKKVPSLKKAMVPKTQSVSDIKISKKKTTWCGREWQRCSHLGFQAYQGVSKNPKKCVVQWRWEFFLSCDFWRFSGEVQKQDNCNHDTSR